MDINLKSAIPEMLKAGTVTGEEEWIENEGKENIKNLFAAFTEDISNAITKAIDTVVFVPVPNDGGAVAVTQFKQTFSSQIKLQLVKVLKKSIENL